MSGVRTLAGKPLPVLVATVVAGGAVVGGATALAPVLGTAMASWSPAWQEATFSTLLYGLLALVAVIGRTLAGLPDPSPHARPFLWGGVGIAMGIGGLILALVDAGLAGGVRAGAGGGGGGVGIAALAGGTLVVLGQSASEELFFRGWLQPALARRWPVAAAIGVTALAFALLHVAGGARSSLTLMNLLLGGVLFGVLAWRGGGLAGAIGAHAGWNWAEGILFGLDPNPGTGGFGAIHDLDLAGAARWGGSGEGLNASVAMTLVLVALILPLVAGMRPRFSSAAVPG